MRTITDLFAPLDGDLFNILTNKIRNLEQENLHLKMQLDKAREESKCDFTITREPEIIDVDKMMPLLRVGSYCSVEKHDHGRHVIAKILTHDVITFSYYLTEKELKNASLEHMLVMLAHLHKNLTGEIVEFYMKKKKAINE